MLLLPTLNFSSLFSENTTLLALIPKYFIIAYTYFLTLSHKNTSLLALIPKYFIIAYTYFLSLSTLIILNTTTHCLEWVYILTVLKHM